MYLLDRAVKVFIVEGENRDLRFIEALSRVFFSDSEESVIINIPSAGNIYMLYGVLKEDDFETDIIEVVREKIAVAKDKLQGISRNDVTEVYLIYDADMHHTDKNGRNLVTEEILNEMLSVFDNETENGKLYISYPMVEAIYDMKNGQCEPFSSCWIPIKDFAEYKTIAGTGNSVASRHFNKESEWHEVLQVFYWRLKCLLEKDKISFADYRKIVTPSLIFEKQYIYVEKESKVFVLSALPELLLDYFKEEFWIKHIDEEKISANECTLGI